jgi:hypothetical protein
MGDLDKARAAQQAWAEDAETLARQALGLFEAGTIRATGSNGEADNQAAIAMWRGLLDEAIRLNPMKTAAEPSGKDAEHHG